MAKGRPNTALGSIGNSISRLLGWGGWVPPEARINNPGTGSWFPLGEPGGGTVQQNGVLWGNQVNSLTIGGGALNSILMESPRQTLQQNAAPLLPRLRMKMMDGQLDPTYMFNTGKLTSGLSYAPLVGVGIYLARLNATGSPALYDVQDPLGASDASRFEWLFHEQRVVPFTAFSVNSATPTSSFVLTPKLFDFLNVMLDIDITPGSALMLTVNAIDSLGAVAIPASTAFFFHASVKGFLASAGA